MLEDASQSGFADGHRCKESEHPDMSVDALSLGITVNLGQA